MKDLRAQRGAAAEELAAQYLRVRGLEILARNLRCKAGELDLVCLDAGVLAIVEVRQRESPEYGGALSSVTWAKQRKIIRAAQYFLGREKRWRNFATRFDVLAIEGLPDGAHRIEWIKDAFRAGFRAT
ncbi:MAG TPA: YraN family protein [Steroidobacteraceae bacterium]|jgi:putative endonuclease|nr:YraN family protein [Steroidobacteraceae bacterium]